MYMRELFDFIVLFFIYISMFYRKWKVQGKDVLFINTIMYIYLSFILYLTLMPILVSLPFIFNHPYELMNLVPFVDVTNGRGDFIRQVVLNIVMTIPFGFLLPLVREKKINLLNVIFYIIGIWFRLVDKCLKQILTMSKIKSNAPALLYFSACKNVTRYIIF